MRTYISACLVAIVIAIVAAIALNSIVQILLDRVFYFRCSSLSNLGRDKSGANICSNHCRMVKKLERRKNLYFTGRSSLPERQSWGDG